MTIAIVHALIFLIGIGYAQNYYFHLRKLQLRLLNTVMKILTHRDTGHHKNNAH